MSWREEKDILYNTPGKALGQLIGWYGAANDRTCLMFLISVLGEITACCVLT